MNMDPLEHRYVKSGKGPNNTIYFKCAYAETHFCGARAKKTGSADLVLIKPHNHEKQQRDEQNGLNDFKASLKRKATNQLGPLNSVYESEARRFPACAAVYPWKTAETLMRRARKTSLPSIPDNLYDLSVLFDNGQLERYSSNNELLYKGCVRDIHGKYSLIFSCQSFVNMVLMLNPTELHADATFKVVPSKPRTRQLLVIHCMVDNYSLPVVYALMETKTATSYDQVIFFIKNNILPNFRPTSIMTDFEPALRDTLTSYFNTAQPYGCWFHHNQAVWKNMKRFGYLELVNSNDKAKKCLRMIMSLPLLPSDKIEEGFKVIKAYATRYNINMTRLFDYYNRYWLRNVGVDILSVYKKARRTNNNIESFHNKLKLTFQVAHPNIWSFLENLCKINETYCVVAKQLEDGQTPTRNTRCQYLYNSSRIKFNTQQLDLNIIFLECFLLRSTHNVARYEEQMRNWTQNIVNNGQINENNPANIDRSNDDSEIDEEINNVEDSSSSTESESNTSQGNLSASSYNSLENNDVNEDADIPADETSENVEAPEEIDLSQSICLVCRVENAVSKYIIIPCGHNWLCEQCKNQNFLLCPFCRTLTMMFVRMINTSP